MAEENQGLMSSIQADVKEEEINDDGIATSNNEGVIEGEDLENVKFEKPEGFPDKFWDEKNGPDYDKFTKSYNNLEKKLSEGKQIAPEDYDISTLDGIIEDDPLITAYTSWAKENGIPQEAFITLASKFIELGGESNQDEKMDIERERSLLGENATEIVKSNINWGRSLVNKGAFTEQDYSELEVLGGTANGTRVIQKIRSMMGEKEIPVVSITGNQLDKEELFARVADPRYKSDVAFRKQTEKMFEENVPG